MDIYFAEPNLPWTAEGICRRKGFRLMQILSTPESRVQLSKALDHMATSLRILDELNVPAEVGAILDLAISRLEAALEVHEAPTEVRSMLVQLEKEFSASSAEPAKPNPWEIRPN
jgi:hypothetical protein